MADKYSEQGLRSEDMALASEILQMHPEVIEVVRAVRQVSTKAKYPVQSFDDLSQALGGDDATVTYRGQQVSLREIRRVVPAYYFPVGSEKDLIAKIYDLQSRVGRGESSSSAENAPNMRIEWAQEREKPEGVAGPNMSIEEAQQIAKSRGQGNNPGLGGMNRT